MAKSEIPRYPEDYPEGPFGPENDAYLQTLMDYIINISRAAENFSDGTTCERMTGLLIKIFHIQELRQIWKKAEYDNQVCELIGMSRWGVYARIESVGFLNHEGSLTSLFKENSLPDLIERSEICGPICAQIVQSRGDYWQFLEHWNTDE